MSGTKDSMSRLYLHGHEKGHHSVLNCCMSAEDAVKGIS